MRDKLIPYKLEQVILSELPKDEVKLVLPSDCVNFESGTVNLNILIDHLKKKSSELLFEYDIINFRVEERIRIEIEQVIVRE